MGHVVLHALEVGAARPAVSGAEDAAFLVGAENIAQCRHEGDVGVAGD